MKKKLAHGALLLVGSLLGLLVAEGVLRVALPQPVLLVDPGLYEPDPPGRYRLAPNYRGVITNRAEFHTEASTNRFGLRSPGAPDDGTRRLLVLGDSFTFGLGVEDAETFSARLGERLDREGGLTVLNAGHPGFGVTDSVSWFERHGLALEPDVALLAIFLGNDLSDERDDREAVTVRDGLVAPTGSPDGLRSYLYRNSHLFLLAKNAASSPFWLPVREALGLGKPWQLRNLEHEMAVYETEPDRVVVDAERSAARALARFRGLADEAGVAVAAVLIPDLLQIDESRFAQTLAGLGAADEDFSSSRPRDLFERLLAEQGIPLLDLTPAFSSEAGRLEQLYYLHDRHWTASGHALASEEIATALGALLDGRLAAAVVAEEAPEVGAEAPPVNERGQPHHGEREPEA